MGKSKDNGRSCLKRMAAVLEDLKGQASGVGQFGKKKKVKVRIGLFL